MLLLMNDADIGCLQNRLQQHANTFEMVSTQHKRVMFFRKQFGLVEAKTIVLGNHYDQCLDAATGSMWQIVKHDMFQYVPIFHLIRLILSDDSILWKITTDRVRVDGGQKPRTNQPEAKLARSVASNNMLRKCLKLHTQIQFRKYVCHFHHTCGQSEYTTKKCQTINGDMQWF